MSDKTGSSQPTVAVVAASILYICLRVCVGAQYVDAQMEQSASRLGAKRAKWKVAAET